MKYVLLTIALFVANTISWGQQNPLLTNEYWKAKPTVAQLQQAIAQGHSPTEFNARSFDATTMAILNGTPYETITYLVNLEGNGVDKLTHDRRTYLFWAAYQDNVPLMEYLIAKGAKVNITESHQFTPLLFAAVGGQTNTAIYKLLLNHGASITDTNNDGANVLLLLIPHLTDLSQADFFLKKGLKLTSKDKKGNNAIHYAATTGNKTLIEALIKKKIKLNSLNNNAENAIFAAARGARRNYNKLEFFQYLEQLGLNPNSSNSEGLTPLFIASARNPEVAVINYFIQKGNNPKQTNKEGRTPLMNAASSNTPEIAKTLLQSGAAINHKDKNGQSALTLAVENNKPEMVQFLLSNGADAQVVDNEGNTLYHYAVKRSDIKILELLANTSLSINQKNNEGLTPLHKAVMIAKKLDIVQFLLNQKADKTLSTNLGETLYDLAQENEALKAVNIDFLK